MMKSKKIISLLLTALMSLSVVGCQTSKSTSSKDTKTLKVVAAMGDKEDIFKQFQKDTGIKVQFLDISSGEVLARAKAQKGKPIADVWFGGGSDAFTSAADAGLLEKYISQESKNIPDEYKDKNGYWTGMTVVTAGLVVNKDVCKQKNLQQVQL